MKAFLKGAAHLLGIWIVIALTFAAAAFMMTTCDVLRGAT